MKKFLFAALAIVFLVLSCDNGSVGNSIDEVEESLKADNPFLGTWESIKEKEFDFDARLIFTENEFSAHGKGEDGKYRTEPDNIWDYTFSGNMLTATHKWTESITLAEYDFEKNKTLEFWGHQYKKLSKKQIIN
jgi:hypothetical protein